MPLPLFPRLVAWYTAREANDPNALLSQLLGLSNRWRSILVGVSGQAGAGGAGKNWDVVLLGGAMGSLFSFCQCLISPSLGSCGWSSRWIWIAEAKLTGSVGPVRT